MPVCILSSPGKSFYAWLTWMATICFLSTGAAGWQPRGSDNWRISQIQPDLFSLHDTTRARLSATARMNQLLRLGMSKIVHFSENGRVHQGDAWLETSRVGWNLVKA